MPPAFLPRDPPMRPCVALLVSCLMASSLAAQEPSVVEESPGERVERLERETQTLRAEIEAYRQRLETQVQQGVTPAEPGETQPPATAPVEAVPDAAVAAEALAPQPGMTKEQFDAEMKKLLWTKGEWKIVPYGILWGAFEYETQKTYPGEFPVYVQSPSITDHAASYFDPRSTRLGIDVTGPAVSWFSDAKLAGKAELDFQRNFDQTNRAGVLFRQAYVEVKNDEYRLLFGQAWEVMSPLYAGSIMYIPGSGAGNLGYRRAQLRAERYYDCSDAALLTLQGSLNSNIISDFTSDPLIVGSHTGWPVIEGRAAVTLGQRTGPDALPITFGVSGHIGEQSFDFPAPLPNPVFGATIPTWSINADLRMPITKRFGFQGEFFHGSNLGAYMGGILQGVDPFRREGIRSTGGWGDLWYDWRSDLHSHVGYSIDDPLNSDVTMVNGRIYNDFWFANLVYDITKTFNTGLEVSYWKTHFTTFEAGDAVRLEMAVRYYF
jgi:hypothetical protein